MPIPQLDSDGYLPPGVHECTLDEVKAFFCRFQASDQRPRLCEKLHNYVSELRVAGIAKYLIVNGSFVTSKDRPNDIDLVLVLNDDVRLDREIPPFQYNARSGKFVKRNYGFDLYPAFEGDKTESSMINFFAMVRGVPGRSKGFLKLII
jgi:hypothetical protein